ncbi:hypothetical protein D9M73_44200 [compost metagenome]
MKRGRAEQSRRQCGHPAIAGPACRWRGWIQHARPGALKNSPSRACPAFPHRRCATAARAAAHRIRPAKSRAPRPAPSTGIQGHRPSCRAGLRACARDCRPAHKWRNGETCATGKPESQCKGSCRANASWCSCSGTARPHRTRWSAAPGKTFPLPAGTAYWFRNLQWQPARQTGGGCGRSPSRRQSVAVSFNPFVGGEAHERPSFMYPVLLMLRRIGSFMDLYNDDTASSDM